MCSVCSWFVTCMFCQMINKELRNIFIQCSCCLFYSSSFMFVDFLADQGLWPPVFFASQFSECQTWRHKVAKRINLILILQSSHVLLLCLCILPCTGMPRPSSVQRRRAGATHGFACEGRESSPSPADRTRSTEGKKASKRTGRSDATNGAPGIATSILTTSNNKLLVAMPQTRKFTVIPSCRSD